MEEEKIIKERKQKLKNFFLKNSSLAYYLILAIILIVNIFIRKSPMLINSSTGKPGLWDVAKDNWTLGPDLDPFLFLRYAKDIAANGHLMALDTMRYIPLGYETAKETIVLPYLIAYLHKLISFFGNFSVDYAAIIFPVVASVFTAIFFFLLVRKIFEIKGKKISNIIALISTAFMISLPSLLPRTIAGIPEKESVGFTFMFLALYLFLCAFKSKNIKFSLVLGILAGAATALMALVWGGSIFIYITIAIAGLTAFIIEKIELKELVAYGIWIISSMIFYFPFTARSSIKGFFVASTRAPAMVVFIFMLIYFILFKTKIRESKFLQNIRIQKIPKQTIAIIVALILFFIFTSIFYGPNSMINLGKDLINKLIVPYVDRLLATVAENKQPFFEDWEAGMGPHFQGIALFFWLFFFGSLLLFYETITKLRLKEKTILTSSFIIFFSAIIFSRYSESSIFNGSNKLSIFTYFVGCAVLFFALAYVYYKRYTENRLEELKEIKFEYIFMLSMALVGIIAGRAAVRLIMVLTPIAAIIVGYFIVEIIFRALRAEVEIKKIIFWVIAGIVIISSLYTLNTYYAESKATAEAYVPSSYTNQWQNAMGWVRENTPENAVFGHWWDYGYWVQSIGERATMLDGGNAMGQWNYLMGRHVLTAETEEEALEVLYSHNVTYFLIDSTDIGKYSAYSSIGSDENYDRYSWIGTFSRDAKQTQETKSKISEIYTGGVSIDEDIIINNNGKQILLPKQAGGVMAMIVARDKNADYMQPEAIIVYNNAQYRIPLRYLYVNEKLIDFGNDKEGTIDACAYLYPKVNANNIDYIGTAMYLSPRNMRALWVRLYLLGEGEHFKLVHTEQSSINNYLKNQGIAVPDIVYYQGTYGPIKIWKIEYTGEEKINPKYLQIEFPEEIASREFT